MALLLLACLLVLIFFYDSKIFVYALMVFFTLFDMLDGFYDDEKIFAALRYFVPLFLILIFIIKNSVFKKTDFAFLILALYLILLLIYSHGDILISTKTLLSVFLTLFMIPVGRYIGRHAEFLKEFEGFNRFLLIVLALYIIICNILNIGESYTESFHSGFLITSRMYIFPIVVFLAIHYMVSNKDKRWFITGIDLVFIIINIGIIIINSRRTALGMLLAALFVYALQDKKLMFKMGALMVFFVAALAISYPLYEKMLTAQLEQRERIQDIDTYEEEGRVLETLYIMDYHSNSQNIFEKIYAGGEIIRYV